MVELYILNTKVLDNDSVFNRHMENVSDFRRAKIDSFVFRKDKNLCLGASIILDKYLSGLGLKEKNARYVLGQFGKPAIEGLANVFFSISHSGEYSCVAFSDCEVGCDIEEIQKIDRETINFCIGPEDSENPDLFYDIWTEKESYLKTLGVGLCKDMKSFSTTDVEKAFSVHREKIPGYSLCVCYKENPKNPSSFKVFRDFSI